MSSINTTPNVSFLPLVFLLFVSSVHAQEPRLLDNQDGTVTDRQTGLMWHQNSVFPTEQSPNTLDWYQAAALAQQAEIAGYNDWRLPTQPEMLQIAERQVFSQDLFKLPPSITFYWGTESRIFTDTPMGESARALSILWRRDVGDDNSNASLYSIAPITLEKQQAIGSAWLVRDTQPRALLKANGSLENVTLTEQQPLSLMLNFYPGEQIDRLADWWLLAYLTPPEGESVYVYSYVYPTGWQPGLQPAVQAPLFVLENMEVLNAPLPAGNYRLFFAVTEPNLDPEVENWTSQELQIVVQP